MIRFVVSLVLVKMKSILLGCCLGRCPGHGHLVGPVGGVGGGGFQAHVSQEAKDRVLAIPVKTQ